MTENIRIKYLLGIDGGGTKTEFLLTDLNGNEKRRIVLGPSNPVNIGIKNTEKILADGINEICAELDKREISLFAGLAGGLSGNNRKNISEFLSSFNFGFCQNGGDTENAIETGLKGENGVVLIIGTGIIGFAKDGENLHRIGGWGYLIDKGGSGFHFGSDALSCALKHIDKRGGSELILNLIEKKLGKGLVSSISKIYEKGPAFVSSFASVVFDAYRQGDKDAENIIDKNAYEIAKIIETGYNFSKSRVVLMGGICHENEILRTFLKKHLVEKIPFEFCTEPMVKGAVALAKNLTQGVK